MEDVTARTSLAVVDPDATMPPCRTCGAGPLADCAPALVMRPGRPPAECPVRDGRVTLGQNGEDFCRAAAPVIRAARDAGLIPPRSPRPPRR
jgi:hypothetical protein